MAQRPITFEEGNYYHVYNRGVDKRKIFFSKGDWDHFLWLLWARNNEHHIRKPRTIGQRPSLTNTVVDDKDKYVKQLVDIVVYVFMGNHFHLLVREKTEGGISKFMAKLLTAFSLYMNKKYNRTGPLMCRPFKAKHVDSDEYFRWLVSYIHMNPIEQIEPKWKENGIIDKNGALKFLREYKYSSYFDYFVGERNETFILNKDALPIDIKNLEDLSEMLGELDANDWSERVSDQSLGYVE